MRRRTATVIAVPALALALSACGGDYSYGVTGRVAGKQIDWDCHGHALAPVAFARTSGGRGTTGSRSTTGGSSYRKSTSGSTTSGKKTTTGGSSSSGGTSLKKKPRKPKKLHGFDLHDLNHSTHRPSGCTRSSAEYELYVKNDDGLFEQDVTSDHYKRCAKGEKFPSCAK